MFAADIGIKTQTYLCFHHPHQPALCSDWLLRFTCVWRGAERLHLLSACLLQFPCMSHSSRWGLFTASSLVRFSGFYVSNSLKHLCAFIPLSDLFNMFASSTIWLYFVWVHHSASRGFVFPARHFKYPTFSPWFWCKVNFKASMKPRFSSVAAHHRFGLFHLICVLLKRSNI